MILKRHQRWFISESDLKSDHLKNTEQTSGCNLYPIYHDLKLTLHENKVNICLYAKKIPQQNFKQPSEPVK